MHPPLKLDITNLKDLSLRWQDITQKLQVNLAILGIK